MSGRSAVLDSEMTLCQNLAQAAFWAGDAGPGRILILTFNCVFLSGLSTIGFFPVMRPWLASRCLLSVHGAWPSLHSYIPASY